MFYCHTRFELRDGSKIIFWDDVWCGEMDLYNIACVKDASVADYLQFILDLSSGFFQWNVSFIGTMYYWEVNVLDSFFTLLYTYRVRQEGKDKLW